jgi:hypothetical protein
VLRGGGTESVHCEKAGVRECGRIQSLRGLLARSTAGDCANVLLVLGQERI